MAHWLTNVGDGGFLIRLVVGVSAIWLVSGLATLALRRSTAALRHRLWALCVVAVLLLPGLLLLLPEWRIGVLPASPSPRQIASFGGEFQGQPRLAVSPPRRQEQPTGSNWRLTPATAIQQEAHPPHQLAPKSHPVNWSGWIFASWLAISLWLLLRQAVAMVTAQQLQRRAVTIVDGPAAAWLERLTEQAGVRLRPALLESDQLTVPVCMGCFRPSIVLPGEWRDWPAEQLQAVLTHELAHVARHDVLWQLLARLACAVYWCHPLAWVAAWRMRVERELACDDWVLRGGQPSTLYARCLLTVATMVQQRPCLAESAGVAMARGNGFEMRISAILDSTRRRWPVSRAMAAVLTVLAVFLLGLVGTVSPLAPHGAAAAAARDQLPATQPAGAAVKTVRVAGRVEDEQGKVVADVLVEAISGSARISARTASDGQFAVALDVNTFRTAFLHVATSDGTRRTFHRLDAVVDGKFSDLRLTLRPARVFAVTVNNDKGQPIPGAWVAVVAEILAPVDRVVTDGGGKALVRMPADAAPMYIVAGKPDVGLDYVVFRRKEEAWKDPSKLDPEYSDPLTLVLNGSMTMRVKVVDEQQHPLAGVRVYPWYFEKKGKRHSVNLAGFGEFKRVTDNQGIAQFNTIPTDNIQRVPFWTRKDGYVAPRFLHRTNDFGATDVHVTMLKQVPVMGQVVDTTGRPVGGATVRVTGSGQALDGFRHTQILSAADGGFKIDVDPEMYYMFVAQKERLASPANCPIIVRQSPAAPIRLVLQPAVRVYGQVTTGQDRSAASGVTVSLVQEPELDHARLPKEQQLPPVGDDITGRSPYPSLLQQTTANDQGRFEFYVAPGKYTILCPIDNLRQAVELEISDKEYTISHLEGSPTRQQKLKLSEANEVPVNLHIVYRR